MRDRLTAADRGKVESSVKPTRPARAAGNRPRAVRRSLSIGDTMKSILDPSFRYVPSTATDVRKTFARIRRELQKVGTSATRAETKGSLSRVLPFRRIKEVASRG
jgi:hypothetical protein